VLGRLWRWEAQFRGRSGGSSQARGAPRWWALGGKEPPVVGQRSGGGRRLRGRGVVVSLGGGRGGEGSLRDLGVDLHIVQLYREGMTGTT
jgi:hypothetical protein